MAKLSFIPDNTYLKSKCVKVCLLKRHLALIRVLIPLHRSAATVQSFDGGNTLAKFRVGKNY